MKWKMTSRTVVEQDFLENVNGIVGFYRRTDGKIERQISVNDTWTASIKGECFAKADLISEDEFLFYIQEELLDVEEKIRMSEEI